MTTVIKSHYDAISEYVPGELTLFSAPPGVGKSTFLIVEGVNFIRQGKKVLHYVLGDFYPKDIANRYVANYTGTRLSDVTDETRTPEVMMEIFPNLCVVVKKSVEFDSNKLCQDILKHKCTFDFDVVLIDSFDNLKYSIADPRLEFIKIKQVFKETNSVGIIVKQPKMVSWKNDMLELSDVSCSHLADVFIGASRTVPKTFGIMNVVRDNLVKRSNIEYLNESCDISETSSNQATI